MKIAVEKQSNKKSPYRLKFQGLTVSLSTRAEAKRVRQFIQKFVKANGINL